MTTITVDLERILASGKKNTYEGRAYAELVSCIARSKRVVCLTGAGISTSAGIPVSTTLNDGIIKNSEDFSLTLPFLCSTRTFEARMVSSSSQAEVEVEMEAGRHTRLRRPRFVLPTHVHHLHRPCPASLAVQLCPRHQVPRHSKEPISFQPKYSRLQLHFPDSTVSFRV